MPNNVSPEYIIMLPHIQVTCHNIMTYSVEDIVILLMYVADVYVTHGMP